MAEITLKAVSALSGFDTRIGDTRLVAIENLDILSIALPRSMQAEPPVDTRSALNNRMQEAFGIALPDPGKLNSTDETTTLMGLQSDQWFMTTNKQAIDPVKSFKSVLADTAYLTDQSDSWAILEISGPNAQAALERICLLDLASDVFDDKKVARTAMEHLSVIIHRPELTRFRLYSPRSSAQSFLHAVQLSLQNVS
ncbi:sarcosine oxidase subunit gamma [Granulosicoccus antarcticus]|uniref:Sarcosine oxidase subunit gamma n=1 Tax=Granulosicoccus antarcticus IMCC3135 TaxID=1192854 RepID=A0A2Z2P2R5_9GAMM|nr:hypothetical protein [Granulosicoccus antarcticus]ASJ75660.1 hypothetical protein IMCC3135_28040 [Granulosicoccus antarcticus IMCC3135]